MKISKNIVRHNIVRHYDAGRERGYILLTLLLLVAVMTIAMAIMVPTIAFEIRRDKEEELVHRGVQYTRAIRNFSKRTGHYPATLAELQDPNGIKYLRKFYKDPITGKDFKLLHANDIPGIGGSSNPTAPGSPPNPSGDAASVNANQQPGGVSPSPDGQTADVQAVATQSAPNQNTANTGTTPQGPLSRAAIGTTDNGSLPGQLIFGVASVSKATTIREFDHKNHYSDWLFFYSPQYDRGLEIKGPTTSSMAALAGQGFVPGQRQLPGAGSQQPQEQPPAEQPPPEIQGPPPPGALQ
jgi:type II secretory pathway pseudopilin PulG